MKHIQLKKKAGPSLTVFAQLNMVIFKSYFRKKLVFLDNIVEYVILGQTTVLGDSKGYYFGT